MIDVQANTQYVHIKLEAEKGNSQEPEMFLRLRKVQREYIPGKPP